MSKCPIPRNQKFDKNKKYIRISETGKNTCQECKSLDGKIFTGDKVPLRPPPNCKCEVEEYKNNITRQILNYGLDKVADISNDDFFSAMFITGAQSVKYNEAENFWKLWYYGFDNSENVKYSQQEWKNILK